MTFLAPSRSRARVRPPGPGPTSMIVAAVSGAALRAIRRVRLRSKRKFWPRPLRASRPWRAMTSRSAGSPSSLSDIRPAGQMPRVFRSLPVQEHHQPVRRGCSLGGGLRILVFDKGIAPNLAHVALFIDVEFFVGEHQLDLLARGLVRGDAPLAAKGDQLDAVFAVGRAAEVTGAGLVERRLERLGELASIGLHGLADPDVVDSAGGLPGGV